MLGSPSIVTRIAVGKTVGFIIGLAGFIAIHFILPEADIYLRWGILLWYTTLGAIIAVFGVFDWHPLLELPVPWWVRAPLIGAWMNFVLALLIHHHLHAVSMAVLGSESAVSTASWFVAAGLFVGLIIGYATTRIGGEGPDTLGN